MFGYREKNYKVLSSKTIDLKSMKQIIEVRNTGNDRPSYLSLVEMDNEGKIVFDCLFLYNFESALKKEKHKTKEEKQKLLEEDLVMLIDPEKGVCIKGLNAYERIENHHMGYTKCGTVNMY